MMEGAFICFVVLLKPYIMRAKSIAKSLLIDHTIDLEEAVSVTHCGSDSLG